MLRLTLERPLVVLDIEATGLNSRVDRIVEICLVKISPDGSRDVHTHRINPGIPIPPAVRAIHGISDEDVADCPSFDDLAPQLFKLLEDCDLSGYNVLGFDIPILVEEFMRAKRVFDLEGRRIVDMQRIYHKKEPRDLSAALAFFCNETLTGAHGAEADALASVKVLEGQLQKYTDLPGDIDQLDAFCNPRNTDWVDRTGRLSWVDNEITINFGKKKGASLRVLADSDKNYLKWILKSDFPRDTQAIVRNALNGEFPPAPTVGG